MTQNNSAAERSAHVVRGEQRQQQVGQSAIMETAPGVARLRCVVELEAENERLRAALRRIANGATGYLDRDSELASWAREALAAQEPT